MISVENLVFEYPTRRALHGVSLSIRTGSITALVGPNGAGKTTLMRCIAALEQPFSGRVTVDGVDVFEEPRQAHARLGYLSDFFGLYDSLTVRQCLIHAADSRGLPRAQRNVQVRRVAEQLSIAGFLQAKAGTLSRGLRQRLAIAQAIVHQPKVLLLDEPAAGLDPEARYELSALLLALRDSGMTILVSSHILAELEDYSTDMVIIHDGRVLENRPVDADAAKRSTVTLELAGPFAGLATLLEAQADIANLRIESRSARFTFPDEPSRRAALLAELMRHDVPVSAFASERTSLQDSYLSRVSAARQDKRTS